MKAEEWTKDMQLAYDTLEHLTPKQVLSVVVEHAGDRLAFMDLLRSWLREVDS